MELTRAKDLDRNDNAGNANRGTASAGWSKTEGVRKDRRVQGKRK